MRKSDPWLRRAAFGPRRKLTATIVTCLVGFASIYPAVDNYRAANNDAADISAQIDEAQNIDGELAALREEHADVLEEKADYRNRAIGETSVPVFRARLVELVRKTGCHLRKIELGPPTRRKWKKGDNPLDIAVTAAKKGDESNWDLRTQRMSVTVDGASPRIQELLGQLHADSSLWHARSMNLKRDGESNQDVVLDLELAVFDLEAVKKQAGEKGKKKSG